MTIPNLRPSEVDDLKNELSRQQRSLDEFDVSATPQRLDDQSGGISADRGTVTIKLRKTGAERTYETGHASTWIAQFASDLGSGIFTVPQRHFLDFEPGMPDLRVNTARRSKAILPPSRE